MLATALLAGAFLVGCGDRSTGGQGEAVARPPASSTTTARTTTAAPATTEPPTTTTEVTGPAPPRPPAPPPPRPAAHATLRQGDAGPAVAALQSRLSDLGYWLPGADGVFGADTYHAVVAFQKAAGIGRDGVVGAATRAALDAGIRPPARSTRGHVVEIDLARQLLLVVDGGRVTTVYDTSTGSAPGTTPTGHWAVTREIDGFRRSDLGLLYRPKYFYEGVAVHGYTSVPSYPASHGCVRVTYAAMDHIWASGAMPVGAPVWVT